MSSHPYYISYNRMWNNLLIFNFHGKKDNLLEKKFLLKEIIIFIIFKRGYNYS